MNSPPTRPGTLPGRREQARAAAASAPRLHKKALPLAPCLFSPYVPSPLVPAFRAVYRFLHTSRSTNSIARSSSDRSHGTSPYTRSHPTARAIFSKRLSEMLRLCSARSIWNTIFAVNPIWAAISSAGIPTASRIARNQPSGGRGCNRARLYHRTIRSNSNLARSRITFRIALPPFPRSPLVPQPRPLTHSHPRTQTAFLRAKKARIPAPTRAKTRT